MTRQWVATEGERVGTKQVSDMKLLRQMARVPKDVPEKILHLLLLRLLFQRLSDTPALWHIRIRYLI
jgi:hypothetical protein